MLKKIIAKPDFVMFTVRKEIPLPGIASKNSSWPIRANECIAFAKTGRNNEVKGHWK